MKRRRLVGRVKRTEPVSEEVYTFSLTVCYTARVKAPNARVARQRLYSMFQWLHDGIGRWLIPKPFDPFLESHWIEFPDSEDFKQ